MIWALTFAIQTSRWERCPAVSGNAWLSLARCTSARALLILDEPTSALGVKQSGVVLKHILQARDKGLGVIFITHNPHHAYPVGDRFLLLKRGRASVTSTNRRSALAELTGMMAGGAELEQLAHELEQEGDTETSAIGQDDGSRDWHHEADKARATIRLGSIPIIPGS